MLQSAAANLLTVVHFSFILFVIFGGLLMFRWPGIAFVHLPAVVWGALTGINNWVCPLTPLEQKLRLAAGEEGYSGGFIEHYITTLIYPDGLTPEIQLLLTLLVVLVNVALYGSWLFKRR
jgi:hypothetical protein